MFAHGSTVYRGTQCGKVVGHVWPGPEAIDGVIHLPEEFGNRGLNEVTACFVQFRNHRWPVEVPVGNLSRVMPMPARVTGVGSR